MTGHHLVDPPGHARKRAQELLRRNGDVDVALIVLFGHVLHLANEPVHLGTDHLPNLAHLFGPVPARTDVVQPNPGRAQHPLQRVQHKGVADRLQVQVEDPPHRRLNLPHLLRVFNVPAQVLPHQPLKLRIRPHIPLERQVDAVMHRAHLQPLLEVPDIPVDRGPGEDLGDVAGLSRLQILPQRGEGGVLGRRDGFKELARRPKVELPIVELPRNVGRDLLSPGSHLREQLPVVLIEPHKLPAHRHILVVHAEPPGDGVGGTRRRPAHMRRWRPPGGRGLPHPLTLLTRPIPRAWARIRNHTRLLARSGSHIRSLQVSVPITLLFGLRGPAAGPRRWLFLAPANRY